MNNTRLTELTDGGDSVLHYHSSDRKSSNIVDDANTILTLVQKAGLVGGSATALHTHSAITGFGWATYVGDGLNDHRIVIGFHPSLVLVWKQGTGKAYARVDGYDVALSSKELGGTGDYRTDCIRAFAGDGFDVGTHNDVNQNGITYTAIAFR